MEEQSKKWRLNSVDAKKIVKVFLWSMSSAALGFIISTLPQIDVPPQYAAIASMIIPTINTALVALQKVVQGQANQ